MAALFKNLSPALEIQKHDMYVQQWSCRCTIHKLLPRSQRRMRYSLAAQPETCVSIPLRSFYRLDQSLLHFSGAGWTAHRINQFASYIFSINFIARSETSPDNTRGSFSTNSALPLKSGASSAIIGAAFFATSN